MRETVIMRMQDVRLLMFWNVYCKNRSVSRTVLEGIKMQKKTKVWSKCSWCWIYHSEKAPTSTKEIIDGNNPDRGEAVYLLRAPLFLPSELVGPGADEEEVEVLLGAISGTPLYCERLMSAACSARPYVGACKWAANSRGKTDASTTRTLAICDEMG